MLSDAQYVPCHVSVYDLYLTLQLLLTQGGDYRLKGQECHHIRLPSDLGAFDIMILRTYRDGTARGNKVSS